MPNLYVQDQFVFTWPICIHMVHLYLYGKFIFTWFDCKLVMVMNIAEILIKVNNSIKYRTIDSYYTFLNSMFFSIQMYI